MIPFPRNLASLALRKLTLNRTGKNKWNSNACALPRRGIKIGNDLYCRDHEGDGFLVS